MGWDGNRYSGGTGTDMGIASFGQERSLGVYDLVVGSKIIFSMMGSTPTLVSI